jgi:hypothetical protein
MVHHRNNGRLIMKKVINTVARTVTFTFEGGLAPIVLDMSQVSTDNRTYAMLHGFAARVGDNAAIQKSAENNYTVTEAMRREAVQELVDHYASGTADWSPKAKAKAEKLNPHIMAIAQKRNCTYEEAQAWFNAKLMAELEAE